MGKFRMTNKSAANVTQYGNERVREVTSEDVLGGGNSTITNLIANSIGGNLGGNYRVGQSEAMARSIGMKPSRHITHPRASFLSGILGGAIVGTGMGVLGSKVLGEFSTKPGDDGARTVKNILLGTGIGAIVGGLDSAVSTAADQKLISDEFDKSRTVTPRARDVNPYVSPLHGQGQIDAVKVMRKLPVQASSGRARMASGLAEALVPIMAGMAAKGKLDINDIEERKILLGGPLAAGAAAAGYSSKTYHDEKGDMDGLGMAEPPLPWV